ncbi:TPA: hypothetical protein POB14_000994 [Escherichia coli]|nr:hypothetical protein [Escherichia coli]
MSTQPLMKHEVVLPVIVDGYHWACNQDRMWNLNELHKELELPSAKEPGQWRSSVRTLLDQDANLHVAHGGSTPGTWATEETVLHLHIYWSSQTISQLPQVILFASCCLLVSLYVGA